MKITGTIIGYDPGGNSNHGVAFFSYDNGKLISHHIYTLATANEVIEQSKTTIIFSLLALIPLHVGQQVIVAGARLIVG